MKQQMMEMAPRNAPVITQVANIIKLMEENQSSSAETLKNTIEQIMGGATPMTDSSPYFYGTYSKCSLKSLPLTYEQIRHAVSHV